MAKNDEVVYVGCGEGGLSGEIHGGQRLGLSKESLF